MTRCSDWRAAVRVAAGIAVGLAVGKPVGVAFACALATKVGVGRLPAGIGAPEVLVLGTVAGVGFTMSLFIAQLAFTDAHLLAAAKLGVLGASVVAALVALGLGWAMLAPMPTAGAALTANEAEQSTDA